MDYIILKIKPVITWVLDIFLPQKCLGCNIVGEIICSNCLLKIKRAQRETDKEITACFDYRDPIIKKAIWNLKYHHRLSIGTRLGQLLYENLLENISDIRLYTEGSPIYIIPVPLYKSRQKERGYNQAKIIAKGLCDSNNKIFELRDDIVIKQINTLQQAKLTNRAKRLKNVHGAFAIIKPEEIKGKTIIVIDDVTTTGGTITEIINILKKLKAKKVIGFAVAH